MSRPRNSQKSGDVDFDQLFQVITGKYGSLSFVQHFGNEAPLINPDSTARLDSG
jgi:hypothetical protein